MFHARSEISLRSLSRNSNIFEDNLFIFCNKIGENIVFSHNTHEVLQKLIDHNITYALLDKNELQFRLYKEMEEKGLTVYDF